MSESESLSAARKLISEQWPHRHEYFGVRLTLRSIIRHARQLAKSVPAQEPQ